LFVKFMFMILSLGLLMTNFVKSLVGSWPGDLRCLWWVNWSSSSYFKSSKWRKRLSYANLSM
jgi:hypothetical protein